MLKRKWFLHSRWRAFSQRVLWRRIMGKYCHVRRWSACSDGELWVLQTSSDCVAQSRRHERGCINLRVYTAPTMTFANHRSLNKEARLYSKTRWPANMKCSFINETPCQIVNCRLKAKVFAVLYKWDPSSTKHEEFTKKENVCFFLTSNAWRLHAQCFGTFIYF